MDGPFSASTEALVGFGLLTASVSSIVLLYPALARMRLLARGVSHIVDAEKQSGIPLASTDSDVVLSSLARDVARARIDLIHFPIVYFFASNDLKARVSMWVHDLVRFASEAAQEGRPEHVRVAGTALDRALDDFASIVDGRYLHTRSRDRNVIFDALVKISWCTSKAASVVTTTLLLAVNSGLFEREVRIVQLRRRADTA